MESDSINTDDLLGELGGCGRFQIIMASIAYLPQVSFAFTMLFMSYGSFNPGWRCMDNVTNTSPANTTGYIDKEHDSESFSTEMKCDDFKACKIVQFNQEASTVVTEWELVCDKDWVPLTMMSLQMVGVLIGAILHGFLSDKFGRKKTLYPFVFINMVFNGICIFSVSWQMYIAFRFLLGITCGVIGYIPCVFITEFVPLKWRVRISSLPFWSIGALLFGIVSMLTKDWKQIHLVSTAIAMLCLLPAIWVPESLRWLLVHGKEESALAVIRKISHWNRTNVPRSSLDQIFTVHKGNESNKTSSNSTIFDLFKRDRILFTIVFGILFLSIDLIYYATSFGVSSLPGNLYVNFIIIFAAEMPSNLMSSTIPNIFGRRTVCMISYAIQAICLFGVVIVDVFTSGHTRMVTILVLVIIARLCLCVDWYVVLAYIAEVYPTVIRSTASGYGGLMAAIGSITAPYLIPSESSKRYISYLIMAGFTLFCCLLLPLLPETKDVPLRDMWSEETSWKAARAKNDSEKDKTPAGSEPALA